MWDGYTVHDAATVLRRYLNDLPEPVVPLDLYERFRDPLRGATKQGGADGEGPQFVENFDEKGAIEKYQTLITELPPLNRQLLLYILDLLAVFAAKSDENRMTSQNLAAIFQPGMLSHPNHAMAPEEYRLNQCVIIFLIENQDHFLIGMQGTAADENTVKEVQSGTPKLPSTPEKPSSGVNRSASNASAGADSVRKEGQLRRNQSVSSKHSRQDGAATPNSPGIVSTPTSGLARSNTLPSKKSPAIAGGKLKKLDGQASPLPEPLTPVRAEPSVPTVEEAKDAEANAEETVSKVHENLESSPSVLPPPPPEKDVPPKDRVVSGIFNRSDSSHPEKRQPNKLRKKNLGGTLNDSAHSSTASLPHHNAASPSVEVPNPLEAPLPMVGKAEEPVAAIETAAATEPATIQHEQKLAVAPEAELPITSDVEDASATPTATKEKKKLWRLSRSTKREDHSGHIGTNENADASTTSFASSTHKPRKSYQADGSERAIAEVDESESGKGDKGPISWIKNKIRDAKENSENKRSKSPHGENGSSLFGRGKSIDIKRDEPVPVAAAASGVAPEVAAADVKAAVAPVPEVKPTETTETAVAVPATAAPEVKPTEPIATPAVVAPAVVPAAEPVAPVQKAVETTEAASTTDEKAAVEAPAVIAAPTTDATPAATETTTTEAATSA